jgi:two-component system cell cycle response regulator DivK
MTPSLPVLSAPGTEKPSGRASSGPRTLRNSGTLARPRVLIVEDHEDTSEMYAWCMRAAGWIVEVVRDGHDALTAASEFAPDVIVMDLRLPVLDGLDATRLLKADPDTRLIPVVGCSGIDGAQAETLAKEAGCDRFVAKPCSPEDLRILLESMVTTEDGAP